MTETARPFDGWEQLWRHGRAATMARVSREECGKSAMRPTASRTASSALCRTVTRTVHVVPQLTSPVPVPGSHDMATFHPEVANSALVW